MGCVNSRTDINDLHPNIFQVMNVDDLGNLITPGRLEVTDTDIVLYQRGKQPIKWPLRCLRRYGYDAEIFSFESGRRCSTGPGIYAFKCRQAAHLFNLVQTNIQVCNNSGDDTISREHPVASHPAAANPITTATTRVTIPVEPNYLDPILNRTTNNRAVAGPRSIIVMDDHPRNHQNQVEVERLDSSESSTALISPQRNVNQSPITTSPPVLPPLPTSFPRSHPPPPPPSSSSLYVNEEILSSFLSPSPLEMVLVEHNNNQKSLGRAMKQRSCIVTDSISDNGGGGGGSRFTLEVTSLNKRLDITAPAAGESPVPATGTGTYMNIDINSDVNLLLLPPPLVSPSHSVSDATTQAIKVKEENTSDRNTESSGHAYMNINPGQEHTESVVGGGGIGRPRPSTLISIQSQQNAAAVEEATRHCYANLESSEIETLRKRFSGVSVSEKSPPPMPPSTPTTISSSSSCCGAAGTTVIREVNYAVLDLDTKDMTTAAAGSPLDGPSSNPTASPPESPNNNDHKLQQQQQQKGYATIDFNKTAALSHSVNPNLNLVNDNEGSRKTRHNSTISALTAPSSSASHVRRSSSVSE